MTSIRVVSSYLRMALTNARMARKLPDEEAVIYRFAGNGQLAGQPVNAGDERLLEWLFSQASRESWKIDHGKPRHFLLAWLTRCAHDGGFRQTFFFLGRALTAAKPRASKRLGMYEWMREEEGRARDGEQWKIGNGNGK